MRINYFYCRKRRRRKGKKIKLKQGFIWSLVATTIVLENKKNLSPFTSLFWRSCCHFVSSSSMNSFK
jgi:hypothetical protein